MIGKLAVLDISESGRQIAEKLFVLLDERQRQELMEYISHSLEKPVSAVKHLCALPDFISPGYVDHPLTEIRECNLYFCLELRKVCVGDREIELTAKEFDIFALLIMNSNRVFTYEMIMDIVWHEQYDYYSRKAINNHISNLRKKLKIAPNQPEYIKSIHSVGYKFNTEDSSI